MTVPTVREMPDVPSERRSLDYATRLKRLQVVGLIALSGCCAVALHTRVYERFDRVRIKVVTSALQPVDGAVVVPISDAAGLAGMPAALILGLQNGGPEARTIGITVNGAWLDRVVIRPRQTRRVDLGVSAQAHAGQASRLELVGDGDDWALQSLELANVHGFSSGLFSFVITPDDAALSDHPSGLAAVLLFGVLLALSIPMLRFNTGRVIGVVSLLPGALVCCFLGATLVLPAVSAFKVLLSVQAFSLCMVALYGPPAVTRLAIVYKEVFFARRAASRPGAKSPPLEPRPRPAFLHGLLDRNWQPLGVAVLASLIVGYGWVLLSHNSFAVGGSDSSGYLSFARMLSEGETSRELAALDLFDLEPARFQEVFTPLGWRRSSLPDRIVPVFPMGLPIQMLLSAQLLGWDTGPFLLGPLSALVCIWLMYLLGRRLTLSRMEAVAGAAVLALWPVLLFIAVQPLSDLNSTVWCMAAALLILQPSRTRAAALGAGFAFGMAVLVRPPTVVLAFPLLVAAWGQWDRVGRVLLGGLPCGVFFLGFNTLAYGHPLTTGNGFLMRGDFGVEFAGANVSTFTYWLLVTLGPVLVAAVALPFDRRLDRRTRLFLVSWFGGNFAFYVFFKAGDAYWWTRYLLPGLPAMTIAGMIVMRDVCGLVGRSVVSSGPPRAGTNHAAAIESARSEWRRHTAGALLTCAVLAILVTSWRQTTRLDPLGIGEGETVYPDGVHWADGRLPDKALILSTQMGTAVKEYSSHIPVRWEHVSPELFEELRRATESQDYRWFALLYPAESEEFQERTGAIWEEEGQFRQVSLWRLRPRWNTRVVPTGGT